MPDGTVRIRGSGRANGANNTVDLHAARGYRPPPGRLPAPARRRGRRGELRTRSRPAGAVIGTRSGTGMNLSTAVLRHRQRSCRPLRSRRSRSMPGTQVGAAGEPAFAAGIANLGSGNESAGFRKDPFGKVRLKGISGGSPRRSATRRPSSRSRRATGRQGRRPASPASRTRARRSCRWSAPARCRSWASRATSSTPRTWTCRPSSSTRRPSPRTPRARCCSARRGSRRCRQPHRRPGVLLRRGRRERRHLASALQRRVGSRRTSGSASAARRSCRQADGASERRTARARRSRTSTTAPARTSSSRSRATTTWRATRPPTTRRA